ncbi:penicillin-binding protein 1C [Wenxinia saemankumensis]|uniref:penicillin-binding protein 1C n=1 Tax=Wenxinia saemankumensis TaxID=1447782 RepID=UPI0009331198|nr:penicillin-binding protein 1C [Wenxinia saemankumensis]
MFALALLLWAGAVGRDAVDRWIDGTILPPLATFYSTEVLARDGTLLRAYTVDGGYWRLSVRGGSVDPGYVEMLIAYEDGRFRSHSGVDWQALARAAWQGLRSGRIVSGGSTLTMQVARLIEDGTTGAWAGKLRQIRVALALERRLDKDAILALYLDHAPFGGNLEGVRAASYAWFGKPPSRLTEAEAALLVAIPQAPESRRPDRHPEAAHAARDRVLARMVRDGVIDAEAAEAALTEPSPDRRRDFPILAAHLADRLRAEDPFAPVIRTTIDAALQARLEALAREAVAGGPDRLQAAIVVLDHRSGEMLASVGSAGYEDDARLGYVDMTRAIRSPGSTLKPLIYGLGFDRGLIHPETLIADRPTEFDGYRPQNFDGLFRGELRVRQALQLSLNVPAVSVAERVGVPHLMTALRRAGATPRLPEGSTPGLAVILGGLGLTLEDLARVHGMLADGGREVGLHVLAGAERGPRPQVLDRAAAWQVGDILTGTPRPPGLSGAEIAIKTGTSYGHRDAWAAGWDGDHVVAVWMGRADGTPVPGAFGADLAAPVLLAAFERLGRVAPLPAPPPETLIVATAELPPPLRRFGPGAAESGPVVDFPPDGAVIEGTGALLRVRDGTGPFVWLSNGRPVARTHRREVWVEDLGPGFAALAVIDADGRSARAEVELR